MYIWISRSWKSVYEKAVYGTIWPIFAVIIPRGRSIDTLCSTLLHRFPHAIKLRAYDSA